MSEHVVQPTEFPEPTWPQLIRRGFTKRCPRCGERKIYDSWFQMKDRCPRCGILFEREPGFFVGAYLINFATVIVLLFLACMGFVAWKATNPDAGAAVPLAICFVISLVVPIFFYPFSRTIWSALHIGGSPIEPHEVEAAEAFLRGEHVPPPSPINGAIGPRRGRSAPSTSERRPEGTAQPRT